MITLKPNEVLSYEQFFAIISNPDNASVRTYTIDNDSFYNWVNAVEDNTSPPFPAGKTCKMVHQRIVQLIALVGDDFALAGIKQAYKDS